MPHASDLLSIANLLVMLGIYGKLAVKDYQHKLMWTDYADRKGINGNGNGKTRSAAG